MAAPAAAPKHETVRVVEVTTQHATQTLNRYEALTKNLEREATVLKQACAVFEQLVGKKTTTIEHQAKQITGLEKDLEHMKKERDAAVEAAQGLQDQVKKLEALLREATSAHETAQKLLRAFDHSLQTHDTLPDAVLARQQQRGNFDEVLSRAQQLASAEAADGKDND